MSEPEFESESSESESGSGSESNESGIVILRIRPDTLLVPAVCTDKYTGVILCDKSHLRALREWCKHFEAKLKLCSIHHLCDGIPCRELLYADTIAIEKDYCLEVLSQVVDVVKWYDSDIINYIKQSIQSLIRSQLEADSTGRDPEEIRDILDDINLDHPPTALFWARFRNLGRCAP